MSRPPRHALYLLPNAFTTAALFCGFYAIFQAIGGNWTMATWLVLAAAALDACDGRVARLTGTESSFGVEYDSLADVVAFGVAPALILFQWSLGELGKIGFAAAFCYCAATAMRLARFNTQAGKVDRRFFIGIPSPAAAIFLASFVACVEDYGWLAPPATAWASLALCLLMAFTMVSPVRFYSFKTLNLRARSPLYMGMALVFAVALLHVFANDLMLAVFAALLGYVAASYGWGAWQLAARCLRRRGR